MGRLLRIELGKLTRLLSLRFSLLVLILFPLVWSYAPGVFDVYGIYVVSAYQVAALNLLSSMEFLLPLLVAIASAELLGLEIAYGTLPTVLLRPVTRAQWLSAKLIVATIYPFGLLLLTLAISLLLSLPLGYGAFIGGTGLGPGGLTGEGVMGAGEALGELLRAYGLAAASLVPVSLLAVLFSVIFMSAAAGALATLAVLILMQLMVVFPQAARFLLSTQLSAYIEPAGSIGWVLTLLVVYSIAFAALALFLFERKDF